MPEQAEEVSTMGMEGSAYAASNTFAEAPEKIRSRFDAKQLDHIKAETFGDTRRQLLEIETFEKSDFETRLLNLRHTDSATRVIKQSLPNSWSATNRRPATLIKRSTQIVIRHSKLLRWPTLTIFTETKTYLGGSVFALPLNNVKQVINDGGSMNARPLPEGKRRSAVMVRREKSQECSLLSAERVAGPMSDHSENVSLALDQ